MCNLIAKHNLNMYSGPCLKVSCGSASVNSEKPPAHPARKIAAEDSLFYLCAHVHRGAMMA